MSMWEGESRAEKHALAETDDIADSQRHIGPRLDLEIATTQR